MYYNLSVLPRLSASVPLLLKNGGVCNLQSCMSGTLRSKLGIDPNNYKANLPVRKVYTNEIAAK